MAAPIILPADANRSDAFIPVYKFDDPQGRYVVPLEGDGTGTGVSGIQYGAVTLTAGAATIELPSVTSQSTILLQRRTVGGTPGFDGFTRNPGTGFSITNSSNTDTSTYVWVHIPGTTA